jgi:hypothetical protein
MTFADEPMEKRVPAFKVVPDEFTIPVRPETPRVKASVPTASP